LTFAADNQHCGLRLSTLKSCHINGHFLWRS
jgi:hypothetical protein